MASKIVKMVTFVPKTHANAVRMAVGDAGAGKIGNYSHSSFSTSGTGRWKSLEGANPTIGKVGEFSEVEEERIEFICERSIAKNILSDIRKVHPYEEVAVDIYALIGEDEL